MADEAAEVRRWANPAVLSVTAGVVAFALLLGSLLLVDQGEPAPPRDLAGEAEAVAAAWLRAWVEDDRTALRRVLARRAPRLDIVLDEFRAGLTPFPLTAEAGEAVVTGQRARVPFRAAATIPAHGTWEYSGELVLADIELPSEDDPEETEPRWRVVFSPATIHPDLTPTRRFEVARTWPLRGAVQLADGSPLPPSMRSVEAGLQAGFEQQLAGRPSAEVRLMAGERVIEVAATFSGTPSTSVRTTLDPALLAAAEAALGSTSSPAALVAIEPSTGAIRAIANRPVNGFNRALAGRYPPGSTFKVVTTLALLANGTTPDSRISCPKEVTVNGRRIRNAEEEELGDIDFRTAFAHSCNTAFIQLAERLPGQALIDAARRVGFDADPGLGTAAATSQFPPPTGVVDQVSAAIGQGRVLATPLQMASVAATVAGGGYRKPHLVAPPAPVAPVPLDAVLASRLQDLMRRAVSDGTGGRAQLPGAPVAGKTGTAEFGTRVPLQTHAWFIGFRGDLAVAVIVEDGGFGGEVAAPIFADFLRRAGR